MASWGPFLINIPLHEVEALQLSLAQAVDLLNVWCSSVKLTLSLRLSLRLQKIRSDESAHCSELLSNSHKLIYLHSPEI